MTNKEAILELREINERIDDIFIFTVDKKIEALDLAIKALEERPQGEWIKIFENPFTNGYVCPFCNHKIQVTEQFLPQVTECESCGADMRGGGE